jgi:hypothetical protein
MGCFATIGNRFVLSFALLIAAIPACGGIALADATMTVSDVQVDVTARDAAAARDQAMADVQSKAFDRLMRRLVPNPADQARIKPTQSEIESLVQDFAVQSERASTVRYIGVYTVRFRAGRVRKYLADAGVSAVGDQQEVMILPVYQSAAGQVLWGSSNPWRTAWDRGGSGDGPVTLVLPNGDSFDTGALSANAATGGDMTALGAIMQRYHSAGVVVALARPGDPAAGPGSGLAITATTYDSTGAKGAQSLTVAPQPGEPPEKIFLRGVSTLTDALESGWRQTGSTGLVAYAAPPDDEGKDAAQGASAAGETLYPIEIPVAGAGDWVAARDRLAATPGVQRVTLDVLTREGAAVTLDFAGDPLALQAALANSGYVLVQTAPADASGPGAFQLKPAGAAFQPSPVPAQASAPLPPPVSSPPPPAAESSAQ